MFTSEKMKTMCKSRRVCISSAKMLRILYTLKLATRCHLSLTEIYLNKVKHHVQSKFSNWLLYNTANIVLPIPAAVAS